MKNSLTKIILLCALALLLLPLAVTFGQGGNTLSWDYDTTGDLFCSATKTDICITGFDLYYAVGAAVPAVAARAPVSACALQAGSTPTKFPAKREKLSSRLRRWRSRRPRMLLRGKP